MLHECFFFHTSFSIAFEASFSLLYLMKAKTRFWSRPTPGLRTTCTWAILPYCTKISCRSVSVTCSSRFPTKMLVRSILRGSNGRALAIWLVLIVSMLDAHSTHHFWGFWGARRVCSNQNFLESWSCLHLRHILSYQERLYSVISKAELDKHALALPDWSKIGIELGDILNIAKGRKLGTDCLWIHLRVMFVSRAR